jgi:hypothetical protein
MVGWVLVLAAAAVPTILAGHIGLGLSFLIVAAAALVCPNLALDLPPRHQQFAAVVYWATNLMILSLMIGFASGIAWRINKWTEWLFPIQPSFISVETSDQRYIGHVIFDGNYGVLIYDHGKKNARLVPRARITAIYECAPSANC